MAGAHRQDRLPGGRHAGSTRAAAWQWPWRRKRGTQLPRQLALSALEGAMGRVQPADGTTESSSEGEAAG